MGVRGLLTFICNIQNGTFKVNILDEIRASPNKIIVIDVLAFIPCVFSSANSVESVKELLCGGRHNKYFEKLERFFMELKEAGATLIFFKDGPVQNMKYETWKNRQTTSLSLALLDKIKNHRTIADIEATSTSIPSIMSYIDLTHLAKKYGEYFVSTEMEADLEIAIYAYKNNALAVITNDSDFLIYEGNWKYWYSGIHFEDLTTIEFNRKALTKILRLTYDDMPYLATIAGNDAISFDEVKDFHERLGEDRDFKFFYIADYIKCAPRPIDDDILKRMCQMIFGPGLKPETIAKLVERFKTSLDLYNLNYKRFDDNEIEPIAKILLNKCDDVAYCIYTSNVNPVITTFFDFRKSDMGDIYKITTELYARMAGIVLYHRQDTTTIFKLYICKLGLIYQFVDEEAVFPKDIVVPSLMELYSDSEDDVLDTKYSLLCWIVSEKLKLTNEIRHLDKEYITTVLALYYLVDRKIFTAFEADLLLLALHRSIQNTIPDDFPHPKRLNLQAFLIIFMYLHVHKLLHKAFTVVGMENSIFPTKLDGVYFHYLYDKGSWMNDAQKREVVKEIHSFRLYSTIVKAKQSSKTVVKKERTDSSTYLSWRRR